MHDLPSPDDIFEELSDKTALQIDRLAPVAFDNAFREMVRYHRFLLALNASRTPEGVAFSYAEVTGDAWNAPHRQWIGQYRRLFERAMDRLPDDDHFIRSLSYAPNKLLPGPSDPELSSNVLAGILGLVTIMIHRIEAWVTKRTTVTVPEGEPAEPRLALAGSDAKAYANILHEIVGGWENVLQQAPLIYRWPERGNLDAAKIWSAFRASWPFLRQHLSNTAYCLAAAVWNEDETAGALFRQSLVRWRNSLSYRLEDPADLRWRRLLFPSILNLDWPEASDHASKLAYDYMPAPTPGQLFASVLDGAHEDAVLLTAALLLFWTIEKKQATDIGGRNASVLLRGEDDDVDAHSPRRQLGFRSLFLDFIRLELAGERFRDGTYAAELDALIQVLDNMTERRVVPGRIFTPSTLRDRDDLLQSFVAMLAATTPDDGDDGLLERVTELAREEEVLPEGDRSLRNVVHQLGRLSTILEQPGPQLARGLQLLAPGRDAEAITRRLRQIVDAAKTAIEEQRLERLKARPVDPAKLERIRTKLETALLNEPSETPFFRNVLVGHASPGEEVVWRDIKFNGIPKAQLTEPPMEASSTHFEEMFVSRSRELAGRYAWEAFSRRSRIQVKTDASLDDESFWRWMKPLVAQVGSDPMLVLSQTAEGRAVRRIMRAAPADRPPLKMERRPRTDSRGSYIGTVDGVDVFAAAFSPGVAWLFSGKALRSIRYAAVEGSAHFVSVDFELGEQMTGTLRVRARQHFDWSNAPIFEIKFQKPEENKSDG
jgi:hypothetical protein